MDNAIIKKNDQGTITLMACLIVILTIFSTGCSTVYVPLKDTKAAIERGSGDCKEKAVAYQAALQDQEIESCVVCGVLSYESKPLLHCWNEVRCPEDGKWKLVDVDALEGQQDGWDRDQSPEYLPYIKFNTKVTVEDIRYERGFSWKSDKKLSYLMQNCQLNWIPIISELDYLL